MPYDWVEPDIFLEHGSFTVYHLHKSDMKQEQYRDYRYSLYFACSDDDDEEDGAFDVRELPQAVDRPYKTHDEQKAIIRDAIDAGHFDDWADPDGEPFKKSTAESPPVRSGVRAYTWRRLLQELQAMSADDLDKPVRMLEPYDDEPASLEASMLDTDEDGELILVC